MPWAHRWVVTDAPARPGDEDWTGVKPSYLPRRQRRTIEQKRALPPGHRRNEPDPDNPYRPELDMLGRIRRLNEAAERNRRDPDELARVFWSPDFVAAQDAADVNRTIDAVRRQVIAGGHANVAPPSAAMLATAEALIDVLHDPVYVKALRDGVRRDLALTPGFDWEPGVWTSALASTAGLLSALDLVLTEGGAAGSLSSDMHHARADRGRDRCTINGLAVAAAWARDRIGPDEKIAVLDVGAECGGGTRRLIEEWSLDHVLHLDVSTNHIDAYDPGPGGHELHVATSTGDYLGAIDRMLRRIESEHCAAVLYSAGVDAIELVPFDRLHSRELLVAGRLREAGVPCAFVLGAGSVRPDLGFDERTLAGTHTATVEAFVDLWPG